MEDRAGFVIYAAYFIIVYDLPVAPHTFQLSSCQTNSINFWKNERNFLNLTSGGRNLKNYSSDNFRRRSKKVEIFHERLLETLSKNTQKILEYDSKLLQ